MARSRPRSPLVAAALSFLFPGLGEWALGDHRRAWLVALPALVVTLLAGGFAVGTVLAGGPIALGALFLHAQAIWALVALDLVALAWRAVSIVGAWRLGRRMSAVEHPSRGARAVAAGGLAALLIATTLVQGAVAAVGIQARDVLATVFPDRPGDGFSIPSASFQAEPTPSPTATPRPSPTTAGATPTAPPTPTPTPIPLPAWAKDGRLDLLLVGSDAGTGRWSLRTDSMILLSVDVATGHAAFFGIPRNLFNVPLPAESAGAFPGGRYPGLLNSLYVYAGSHPDQFPGGDARGFRALTGAVQELVGVPLDGFVAVDLQGFVKLVDAVGGLWIQVPKAIYDDRYPLVDGTGYTTVSIPAGCQQLSGDLALQYARTRHQDSDYGRMARQQAVLLALRRQLDPIDLLARAPELLAIAKDDLFTTLRLDDLAGLANLASRVDAAKAQKVLFVPPTYSEFVSDDELAAIRGTVRGVFEGPWQDPASGGSSGGAACP